MNGLEPISLATSRIAVLLGGTSPEREISLESGSAVCAALQTNGHDITAIDPASTDLNDVQWHQFDAVFVALHGTFGEDGQVQEILETARIPFTGSGSRSSRRAFSKSASKERFSLMSLPTPEYAVIHQTEGLEAIREKAMAVGLPVVLKPDAQGSSIGVTIVRDESSLEDAVEDCFKYGAFGVIEKAIVESASEWTVAVIDGAGLPPIRIGTDRGFFDYDAKYHDNNTRYEFDVPPDVATHVSDVAVKACQGLGTRGVARVDLMVDGQDRAWLLEVNTIPGFTTHSLVPKAAARIGLSMGQLCELLIAKAIEASEQLRRAS